LKTRLAIDEPWSLTRGLLLEKSFLDLRSFVCEPVQYGRVCLAGDAAHIFSPNALNPGKDMSHRSDCVLVEVGAPLSAHHRDGQVQFGAGIKAYPESFHSLQVVDLARDELTVGRNQRSQRPGCVR
jgi:hypothetical protein